MSDNVPPPPPVDPPEGRPPGGSDPSPYGQTPPPEYPQQPPSPYDGGSQYPSPPPPPPNYPHYGAPPYGADGYSATEAISYGWRKFKSSPGPLLIGVALLIAASFLLSLVAEVFTSAVFDTPGMFERDASSLEYNTGFFAVFVSNLIANLAGQLLIVVGSAALLKGALDLADGKAVSMGSMFQGWRVLPVVIASLLVSVATAIGLLLVIIPGLIVIFLTSFTTVFIVDRNLSAVEGIKASVNFTTSNVGPVLLYALLAFVILLVGACLCGVGLLVAGPIVLIGTAYTYRVLHNQPVSPAA